MSDVQTGTDLTVIKGLNALNPVAIFTDVGADSLLEAIHKEVKSVEIDITTEKGRSAVASLAYKVARSKTALDEMGRTLKSDLQKQVDKIDGERKRIRDNLDALRDEVREPLTKFEEREKLRVAGHNNAILSIQGLQLFSLGMTVSLEMVEGRLRDLLQFEGREWEEFEAKGKHAYQAAHDSLTLKRQHLVKYLEEQAAAEKAHAEEQERQRLAREEKLKAEAAEAARLKAEAEAKAREEAAAAEARKREQELAAEAFRQRWAKEKAQRDAEEAEKKRLAVIEKAKHDAAEAEQRRQKEAADAERRRLEAEALAERQKQQAIEDERKRVAALEEQKRQEEAARERSKKNRRQKHTEIAEQLVVYGLDQKTADRITLAIAECEIPHLFIRY